MANEWRKVWLVTRLVSPARRAACVIAFGRRFVNVEASLLAGLGVRPALLLRKHELPAPLAVRVRILKVQGVW